VIVPSSFGVSLLSIGVSIFISIVVAASLVLPRKCGKRTRDGHTCGNWCIPGTTVCHLHGGKAPQALRAAKEFLASLVYPTLAKLHELLEVLFQQWRSDTCPTCGFPKGDPMPVIKSITVLLDRAGVGPSAKLDVRHEDAGPSWNPTFAQWMPNWQLTLVKQWADEARARMERGEPSANPSESHEPPADAIDGTVIEFPKGHSPVAAQPNDVQPAIDAGTSDRQESDQ
jgi:hypothetical protein